MASAARDGKGVSQRSSRWARLRHWNDVARGFSLAALALADGAAMGRTGFDLDALRLPQNFGATEPVPTVYFGQLWHPFAGWFNRKGPPPLP